MVLVLVLSLLAGQTIYEWVDAKGDSHFTDDVSTIPAKARRRITSGASLSVVTTAEVDAGRGADGGVDGGARPAARAEAGGAAAPDSCVVARQRVSQLEQQIERARVSADQAREREGLECQQQLNLHGAQAFARCMASRAEPALQSASAQRELDGARETFRRAQVSGCR